MNSPSAMHQASVSSPISSPRPTRPQPHHTSAAMSPNVSTPTAASPAQRTRPGSSDRTSTLLNLLKFAQPNSPSPAPGTASGDPAASRLGGEEAHPAAQASSNGQVQDQQKSRTAPVPASDLVTALLSKPGASGTKPATPQEEGFAQAETPAETEHEPLFKSPAKTQELLLRLLNHGDSPADEGDTSERASADVTPSTKKMPDSAIHGLSKKLASASLEEGTTSGAKDRTNPAAAAATTPASKEASTRSVPSSSIKDPPERQNEDRSKFTYTHPLPSPRDSNTARPGSSAASAPPVFNILKRPGRQTPEPIRSDIQKRKSKETSPESGQASTRRKLESWMDRQVSGQSSPGSSRSVTDDRARFKSRSHGSPRSRTETVAGALDEVGAQVSREVEEALSKADRRAVNDDDHHDDDLGDQTEPPSNEVGRERLVEKADETDDGTRTEVAEKTYRDAETANTEQALTTNGDDQHQPTVADATDDVVADPTVIDTVADAWESADGDDSGDKDDGERQIRVYNFPMRPFVALTLEATKRARVTWAQDEVLDIARFKKDFDQTDRSLVVASKDYITYAMVKNGGIRVIRQVDGRDKQLFGSLGHRIFHVVSASGSLGTASGEGSAVFGTGVDGSVYWVDLAGVGGDRTAWDELDTVTCGLIFPPMSRNDESSSNGHVKTRTKRSSRHPQFFAIGRGKAIYIIWPGIAQNPRYLRDGKKERLVDLDKYLQEHSRKISTGKAGKDFVFSEDDSVIISLDKAGKLSVWDVRRLTDEANNGADGLFTTKTPALEVKTPMVTYLTTVADEKAWPSSVAFVDKFRPYIKGTAQRYLLVGLKQNHTLQLWDFALGRPVQELHFPHEQETDAICSVSFHATSGIIIVGHPTRNSIYFLTLSSPKYTLPSISQATYFQRLAQRDSVVMNPDATAIITGMREYSFGSRGQLRSVSVLPMPATATRPGESPIFFELYVMHSKGVSCLSITAADLGWDREGRILRGADAIGEGLAHVETLRQRSVRPLVENPSHLNIEPAKESIGDVKAAVSTPRSFGPTLAPQMLTEGSTRGTDGGTTATTNTISNESKNLNEPKTSSSVEKPERRKKKRGPAADAVQRNRDDAAATPRALTFASSYSQVTQRAKGADVTGSGKEDHGKSSAAISNPTTGSPMKAHLPRSATAEASSINVGVSSDFLDKEVKKIEKTVVTEFNRVINAEMARLYHKINEDTRIQQAAGDAKLEAVLRLVSSTLTENVESCLARMVLQGISQSVIPTIKTVMATSLERNISASLKEQFRQVLPRELMKVLPDSVSHALQRPETSRAMVELITDRISTRLENEVTAAVAAVLSPMLKKFTHETAESMAVQMERRVVHQVNRVEDGRRQDSAKIDDLQELVRSLTQTVSRMAEVQTEFQQEILKLRKKVEDDLESVGSKSHDGAKKSWSRVRGVVKTSGSNLASAVRGSPPASSPAGTGQGVEVPPTGANPEEGDLRATVVLFKEGKLEAATVKVSEIYSIFLKHSLGTLSGTLIDVYSGCNRLIKKLSSD